MDALRRIPPERAADAAVIVMILLFGWLGMRVHDSIGGLAEMAVGIRRTGEAIESSGMKVPPRRLPK